MYNSVLAGGGDPVAATANNGLAIMTLTYALTSEENSTAYWILVTWITWTIFSVIELVVRRSHFSLLTSRHNIDAIDRGMRQVFVAASVAYIKNLWSSIGKLTESATNSTRKIKSLNGAVSSLIAQSVVTTIIGTCFLTVSGE